MRRFSIENMMTPEEIDEVNTRLWAELDEIKEKTGYNAYCAASTGHRWTLLGYLLNLKHKADAKAHNAELNSAAKQV